MGPYRRELALVLSVCAILAVLIVGPGFFQWVGLAAQPRAAQAQEFPWETIMTGIVVSCIAIFACQRYFGD